MNQLASESSHPDSGRGHVFVIAAPSGTGKTTICRRILEEDPLLTLSVSHTTRSPRKGEQDGMDYYFVDDQAFLKLVETKRFLEHAEYNGKAYGTSWGAIEAPLVEGRDVVLEIEVQGAAQVRERMPEARLIFLLPPSLETLAARLRGRGTDAESVILHRLALVDRELAAADLFDYAIINDDLDVAVANVLSVIDAVRHGRDEEAIRAHGRERVMRDWQALQEQGTGHP